MNDLFFKIPCLKGERVTLRRLTACDADALRELTEDADVYRYLPTFLYEKQYEDPSYVIDRLYDECINESLILGVFLDDAFCGLAEVYGYRAPLLKVSVGYRLLKKVWGKGIATETLGVLVKYLLEETPVSIITASTMVENQVSANVLRKNGFKRVMHGVWENWGYPKPTVADKWLLTDGNYRLQYRFHNDSFA